MITSTMEDGKLCVQVTISLNPLFCVRVLLRETSSGSTLQTDSITMTFTTKEIRALPERCRKSWTSSRRISYRLGHVLMLALFLVWLARSGVQETDTTHS